MLLYRLCRQHLVGTGVNSGTEHVIRSAMHKDVARRTTYEVRGTQSEGRRATGSVLRAAFEEDARIALCGGR